jgi:predicted Zn-dependent protease
LAIRKEIDLPHASRLIMIVAVFLWTFVGSALHNSALAQNMLRDAEAEWFLRYLSSPFAEAAGLTPRAINYFIVGDPALNAFVAAGQNIFITSGTIMTADDVRELQGVLAHEMGHISGAHQARMLKEGGGPATMMALITMLLGAAAIAAGSPDAGVGIMMGGQSMAQRTFLRYTRAMESSADQAAVKFLETTGVSGQGILKFFDRIRDQDLLTARFQDPYARTHPLTRDRVMRLRAQLEPSQYFNAEPDPDKQYWFLRIKAKLAGYIDDPEITLQEFPLEDKSVFARYARVYAYDKALEWDKAIAEANSLVEEFPEDPFFEEILGQIYLENGRVKEAVPHYRRANELAPNTPLIMVGLGHAIVAFEDTTFDAEAIDILSRAVVIDRFNALAWRQLGELYYRNGKEADSSLATAELLVLTRQYGQATHHARKAVKAFPEGSPKWLRAQDILMFARTAMGGKGRQRGQRQERNNIKQKR